ncbi:condensation domain-containing protein [Oscillatoria sp. CS-180]|uniref:condensation domain-containing protein n=1 Tax=Oscillatoria sp. CS-180 TaxID=3021720 RepID=UPI00232F5661|nr:condensation domain-containing protein [Oscillatoria sp. CS-180]MDB9527411.1 condensation domain-containing protein [Oscillatoria sp. CS-180]
MTHSSPSLSTLMARLKAQDVQLRAENGRLHCNAPTGVLTAELQAEIVAHKPALLKMLAAAASETAAIAPVPHSGRRPLSFGQQRIWVLEQLEDKSATYNESFLLRLEGPLQIAGLRYSLQQVWQRHEVLRYSFQSADGVVSAIVNAPIPLSLPIVDLQALASAQQAEVVQQRAIAESRRPFDLAVGPLLRLQLLHLQPQSFVLLLTAHHIIFDGWSQAVLSYELQAAYAAYVEGKPMPSAPLPIQYGDYALWQRQQFEGDRLRPQLRYWQQQLAGAPMVIDLPTDRPRPTLTNFEGGVHPFELPAEVVTALRQLSQQAGATVFMTLFAAFNTLLHRYTGQTDILIGTDIANRTRIELERLIGFFVNLLVLRTDLSGDPSFRQLLDRVRQTAIAAYQHQDLPFEKLVEALQPERQTAHNPLVQVLFVFQNTPPLVLEANGLRLTWGEFTNQASRFDLALFINEHPWGLEGVWKYKRALFDPKTVARFSQQFLTLLDSLIAQPNVPISTLELLTETEKQQQFDQRQERQRAKEQRLKRTRRRGIDLAHKPLLREGRLQPDQPLPWMIEPNHPAGIDLVAWCQEQSAAIESRLLTHGALLFRGFGAIAPQQFEQVAAALCPGLLTGYGDLPQFDQSDRLYHSTPYPADKAILFHNESAHLQRWPLKQFFCCQVPAQQGGATPLVDCRELYRRLPPEIRTPFEQKQVRYVRNFVEGLDVRWQDFFQTNDPALVELACVRAGIEFEWRTDGGLRLQTCCPAIIHHPKTAEPLFFNQLLLHHIACLKTVEQRSLRSVFSESDLPRHVYYGDGTPIADDVMTQIDDLYQQVAIRFTWQAGDILMLDNMLTAHGRDPFKGERLLLVAMGEPVSQTEQPLLAEMTY